MSGYGSVGSRVLDATMGLGLPGDTYSTDLFSDIMSPDSSSDIEDEEQVVAEVSENERVTLSLKACVKREVRLRSYRASDVYYKGVPVSRWNGVNMREQQQKVFVINDVYQALDDEQLQGFYQKFHEKVYTRLIMPTGCGKTTKVPWALCKKIRKNVLLLVPTVGLLKYAYSGLKANKASVVLRSPTRPSVIVMTYADFVHCCAYQGHVRFLKLGIGAVLLDECHDLSAHAFVARAVMSTFLSSISVVLMSATQVGIDMQSQRRVVPRISVEPCKYEDIFLDLRWENLWARDRTCVFMAGDYDVYRLQSHLESLGYIVDVLDSASTWRDMEGIMSRYVSPSPTPRFIVAIPKFGTGYALPVRHIIDSGVRLVEQYDGKMLAYVRAPISAEEVLQHAGRAGRDIEGSCSCVVLSDTRLGESVEIVPGDRLEAWLLLKICGIRPGANVLPGTARFFGTKPMVTRVAAGYFITSLPIPVYNRLLGNDGNVASEYKVAVQQWAYNGRRVPGSEDDLPVGYEDWVTEAMGKYDGDGVTSKVMLKLPFVSMSSNRVLLHSIAAMHRGIISNFEEPFFPDLSGIESDSDEEVSTHRVQLRRLQASLPPPPVDVGCIVELPRVENGFGSDDLRSSSFMSRRMTVLHKAKKVYIIKTDDDGSTISIEESVYKVLLGGRILDSTILRNFVNLLSPEQMYIFVTSEIFDKWGEAWITFGRSLSDMGVLEILSAADKAKTNRLVSCLAARFDRDVAVAITVSAVENYSVKESFLARLFSRKSPSSDVDASLVWIEQSGGFVQRVAQIHSLLCTCITAHERAKVFSPNLNAWFSKDVPWGGGSVEKGHDGILGKKRGKVKKMLTFA